MWRLCVLLLGLGVFFIGTPDGFAYMFGVQALENVPTFVRVSAFFIGAIIIWESFEL